MEQAIAKLAASMERVVKSIQHMKTTIDALNDRCDQLEGGPKRKITPYQSNRNDGYPSST